MEDNITFFRTTDTGCVCCKIKYILEINDIKKRDYEVYINKHDGSIDVCFRKNRIFKRGIVKDLGLAKYLLIHYFYENEKIQ